MLVPKRPVDLIQPGRREAIAAHRCCPPPIGCGGQAMSFKDEVSEDEYVISGLCQECQDDLFNGES